MSRTILILKRRLLQMKKGIASLLAVILILTLTVQPVLAAGEIISIKVGKQDVYINGEFKDIYTYNKQEDITVTTTNTVDHIHIGFSGSLHQVTAYTVSSATYTFKYQGLEFIQKGINTINVETDDSSNGTLEDKPFDVYYCEKDSYYRTENVFKGGSITAFDSGIKLNLGKDNYYKDHSTDMATTDTVMTINVEDRINTEIGDDTGDLKSYSCVSPVYKVMAGDPIHSDRLSKPATLSIKVDAGVPPSQYSKLCIIRSDSNDEDFSNPELLGGVTSSGIITTDPIYDLQNHCYAVALYNRAIDADWAEFSVTPLVGKGMISETLVDNDDLTDNTTRANFAKMVVRGMGVPLLVDIPANPVFDDTNTVSAEDRLYIETAAAYGIMRGDNTGSFNPSNFLKREEAAAVLSNVAKLKLVDDQTKVKMSLEKLYADSDTISSWAEPAVLAVTQAKLMTGMPSGDPEEKRTEFSPITNLTYLESATMVYNLMKKNKRL